MKDFKHSMGKHVRFARHWLTRAEEAFDKERHVRGELDIMLAQAELQHARETDGARRWYGRIPLLGQIAAFCLALVLLTAGFGGAYWLVHDRQSAIPVPLAATQEPRSVPISLPSAVFAPAPAPARDPGPAPAAAAESSGPAAAAPVERAVSQPRPTEPPAAREISLPPADMQKLVRTAEKSLRGQEIR